MELYSEQGDLQLDATMVSPGDSVSCTATVTDPRHQILKVKCFCHQYRSCGGFGEEKSWEINHDIDLDLCGYFLDLNDGTLTPTFSWTTRLV